MTREELIAQVEAIQASIQDLSIIEPKSYEEYNQVRLQFDNLNLQLQAVHMQMDAMAAIEQLTVTETQ